MDVHADDFADLLVLEQGAEATTDLAATRNQDGGKEAVLHDPRASQMQDLIEAMQLWRAFDMLIEAGRLSEMMDLLQQLLDQLIKCSLAR